MGRMTRRTKEPEAPAPQTDAFVGRELIESHQHESEALADTLSLGETVQYYSEGWRVGKVDLLPDADEPEYGQVRILRLPKGTLWVAGRDVRKIKAGV